MRFNIDKASNKEKYDSVTHKYYKQCPCEEAVQIETKFYIEITTLDELLAFVKKYGDLIVTKDSILIYDDHVE